MNVALLGLVVTLFVVLAAHRLTLWRDRQSARRAASAIFREAFADTLLNLERNDTGTARIVREFNLRHDVAVSSFRPYVRARDLRQYDLAVKEFKEACSAYQDVGVLGLFSTELGPQALENRRAIVENIHRLIAFAPQL